ncbi:MAG: peptidoglycan-binding protein [Calothrix sp. C42_A2020_038]|nr:peptidoglycan-binding protein [Calothrix sp. C42_A2020_038]
MDIYVQSRGLDRDYYWTVKRDNQPEEEIPTSPPIVKKATALIDDEVFSVVILRSQDNNLLLLVAGLQTTRQDIKTRMIRNSVALIGTNKDEPILRKVAALALQNEELENKINQAVENSPEGFKVNWEKIKDIISVSTDQVEDLPNREDRGKIALLSEAMKQSLATELLRFSLPQKEEALVIVTKSKSKETLVEANVWRGLSNDPSISTNWMLVPGDKHTNPSAPFKPKIIVLLLVIIIVTTVLIVIRLNSNSNQPCGGNQQVLTRIISDLKPTVQSEKVKTLQRILTTENIKVKIDGIFDADTKKAVEQFQQQYNQGKDKVQQIQVDGIVNDATLKALWQETKNNKTQNNISLEEELWNNGLCKL